MNENESITEIINASESDAVPSKQEYLRFLQMLLAAHHVSQRLHDQVVVKCAPFDRELCAKFKAIQDAEGDLIRYCESKLERSPQTLGLPPRR